MVRVTRDKNFSTHLILTYCLFHLDLLCISDRETWAYGEALRLMTIEKGFTHISFNRIRDLVSVKLGADFKLGEITYVANATNFRRGLLNKYGRDDLDIDNEIATNPDTKMTYCGYRRFLESDLQHAFPTSKATLSGKAYKKNVSYLAKEMLRRGYVSHPTHPSSSQRTQSCKSSTLRSLAIH